MKFSLKAGRIALLLTLFCSLSLVTAQGDVTGPLDDWLWRNPIPQRNNLSAVAFGSGTYVTVGIKGTILTSTDGSTWTLQRSPTTDDLYAVTFGNGLFVAVGYSGIVLTSSDGVSWAVQNSGSSAWLFGVTFANGTFVAVGSFNEGVILTSTDAISWTPRVAGTSEILVGVAFGNGSYVAIGQSGTALVSTNGITWTANSSGTGGDLSGVAFGNGKFVASGAISGNSLLRTSPDGVNWTTHNLGIPFGLDAIAFGNGKFVAVGYHAILNSTDGNSWNIPAGGTTDVLRGVGYGNSGFVAVGSYGEIVTSADASSWTERQQGTGEGLFGITYNGSNFVVVGSGGEILTSPTGQNWTEHNLAEPLQLNAVAAGAGVFTAVGECGTAFTSPDGVTWTPRFGGCGTVYQGETFRGLTYGNGTFVAVGDYSIITSTNSVNWTPQSPVGVRLNAVAYGSSKFVVVGESGVVLTSPDGLNWSINNTGANDSLRGVTYGGALFAAVTEGGAILTSSDGSSWARRDPVHYPGWATLPLYSITFAGGTFLAGGGGGFLLSSTNGIVWEGHQQFTSANVYSIAYANGHFVTTGDAGVILQSGNGGQTCSVFVFDTNQFFSAVGGTGYVHVVASQGCKWAASTPQDWIGFDLTDSYNPPGQGNGSGNLRCIVTRNTSAVSRTGTVSVAGQVVTVVQAGSGCIYSIAPMNANYVASAANGTVTVTTSNACSWTALSNDAFINITSGSSGSGNGTVNYSVEANADSSARSGTITIAGQTFTVNQSGAVHDLAVVKLKAPKKIALSATTLSRVGKFSVTIQNSGPQMETIPDLATLGNLVSVAVQSLGTNCASLAATLVPPKASFPIHVAPNKKLNLSFAATFNCANDPLASTKIAPHPDYRTVATVDLSALGEGDTATANDLCPRPPNGSDPGCGNKTTSGALGADVLTDVVVK